MTTIEVHDLTAYLTRLGPDFTAWPQLEDETARLSAAGAEVVGPLLHAAAWQLAAFSAGLANPLSAHSSNLGIDLVLERAERLLLEVLAGAPREATLQLREGLADPNPAVRLLAAVFCGLKEVRAGLLGRAVEEAYASDSDVLVRFAAATALVGLPGTSPGLRTEAWTKLARYALHARPELMDESEEGEGWPAAVVPFTVAHLVRLIGMAGSGVEAASPAQQ